MSELIVNLHTEKATNQFGKIISKLIKVGDIIFPKKTEEALKKQKPGDKDKFPFLYIGHQDSIKAERGKSGFEKLFKK